MSTWTRWLTVALTVACTVTLPLDGAAQSRAATIGMSDGRGERHVTPSVFSSLFWGNRGRTVITLIVLWRGEEGWLEAGRSRRASGGGGSSGQSMSGTNGITSYSVSVDALGNRAVINETDTVRISGDSTNIIMVDRVDRVGGPPIVTSVAVPFILRNSIEPMALTSRDQVQAPAAATQGKENSFVTFLNSNPASREFIRTRPNNTVAVKRDSGPPPRVTVVGQPRGGGAGRAGSGAGTSSGSHSFPVSANIDGFYFYEMRNTQFVTLIVLERGQSSRKTSSGGGSSMGRGQYREYTTDSGTFSVARDPSMKHVLINRRDTVNFSLDSTMILLLDYRNAQSGRPAIKSIAVPLLPVSQVADTIVSGQSAAIRAQLFAGGTAESNIVRYLQSVVAAREFIRP